MDDLKYIRIIEPGYTKYTGEMGIVLFKDGVSIEKWPLHVRNRMAAAMRVVEVNEDGTELAAGPAEEMLRKRLSGAPVTEPLKVQSHNDKLRELVESATGEKQPAPIRTQEELEAIAREKKRQGLLDIAKEWNVKATSIPTLIEGILEAQAKFLERTQGKARKISEAYVSRHGKELEKEKAQEKVAETPAATPAKPARRKKAEAAPAVPAAEPVGFNPAKKEILQAAMTGDLSAAINSGE